MWQKNYLRCESSKKKKKKNKIVRQVQGIPGWGFQLEWPGRLETYQTFTRAEKKLANEFTVQEMLTTL